MLMHQNPHFTYILFSKDTSPWYNVESYLQETRVMGSKIYKKCKECIKEKILRGQEIDPMPNHINSWKETGYILKLLRGGVE